MASPTTAHSVAADVNPLIYPVHHVQPLSEGRYSVLSGKSGSTHVVEVRGEGEGEIKCDCDGFYYRHQCSHVGAVVAHIAGEYKSHALTVLEAQAGWHEFDGEY